MLRAVITIIGKAFFYREKIQQCLIWIGRFGYLLFILYGLIEWLRPGTIAEKLQRRRTLLYCIFSVILGSCVSFVIGCLWHRRRPFVAAGERALIAHKDNPSFPSNHSMNAMAAACMLLARHNVWGIPFALWAVVLGATRVICRLHYISDVVGGFAIGIASMIVVKKSRLAKEAATSILWIYDGIALCLAKWIHYL